MPEPFMESHTPIHHPCCWELTNQPARIKLPQTLSSVAGSFIQFERKIPQNPDSIKYIRNYLGVSGVEKATAVYKVKFALQAAFRTWLQLITRNCTASANLGKRKPVCKPPSHIHINPTQF